MYTCMRDCILGIHAFQCMMNNLVAAAVEATNFVPVLISVPRAHKTEIISFQITTLCIITRAIVKSRRAAITLISRLLATRLFSE